MSYVRKTVDKRQHNLLFMLLTIVSCVLGYQSLGIMADEINAKPIHPLADVVEVEKIIPVDSPDENIDGWIAQYSKKYANASYPESYLKYQLHCLANKESGHRYNDHKNCGDSGKACGLYQYHEPTWVGFQKIMGLDYVDRWDNERQVQVTAWALSDGRHQNWGPYLRGQCH